MAVITTSGVLASLLLALSALATGATDFTLASDAKRLVVASTVAFAIAALGALGTNFPLLYASVRVDQMRALMRQKWTDDATTAEQRTAATLIALIDTAKKLNRIKGWLLFCAMAVEAIAVVLLAIAVAVILI
jgi:hypothetical protein